ncbi:MAG: SDR family NAD(P)-dependent oxidoreductase [Novosphingobium sp.]|nr:SDR family NAD(P)-dependent oxidoreductase [Novosphingobium sp.]
MLSDVSGQVALVTGASKGMGRHFVRSLADAGMKVAALARPSAELTSLQAEGAFTIPCDIADPTAVNAAVADTVGHFGRLDVVVANAAIYRPFAFEAASDADIRDHFEINVFGVAWLIRAAIPHLRATRGHMIGISSESVRMPFPMLATYAASKAALETLFQGLRDELRSDGIRMTILRSGNVKGGSGGANWDAAATEAFYRKIVATGHAAMTGEPASPESMAEALLSVIRLPRDISVDLVEVRAAREGMPDGAKASSA